MNHEATAEVRGKLAKDEMPSRHRLASDVLDAAV
jgi:hypothetical protein